MTKGILLIALGNPAYLQMAITLAASIKDDEPDLDICLVTDIIVADSYKKLFSQVKKAPKASYHTGDKVEYIKAKLFMYDFSPYDQTLFLDVDQICLPGRKLSPVFQECKDLDFTMSNTGVAGTSIWVDLEEVKKVYGDKKPFWNYHSEFVYFKKCDRTHGYFEAAKQVYQKAKLKTAKIFGGCRMADELAFQIASIKTDIYPHKENWTPNFWFTRNKKLLNKYPYQLGPEWLTYSIGGKHVAPFVKTNYNILASSLFKRMKLQYPYQVRDKRSFLPERSKI